MSHEFSGVLTKNKNCEVEWHLDACLRTLHINKYNVSQTITVFFLEVTINFTFSETHIASDSA